MKYMGNIIDKDIYNHSSKTPNKTAEIINKFKNEIFEINIYILYPNENFNLRPPKDSKAVKSYYILEGSIYNYDTKKSYSEGDIIVLEANSDPFNIQSISTVKILVQSVYDNSYEESNLTFKTINETLFKIQEKDSYTSEHCHRVYELVRIMALETNYTGHKLRNILYAAKYHDVGKIYIEDSILNKPSMLSHEEFEIMKDHVIKSKDLMISSFNETAYLITSQHHERIDGSGYPLGLCGNQILEESMILAICDSFDAMVTDRVYKKGKSFSDAILELKGLSGIKYDKYLIELFINKVLQKYIDGK